MIYYALKIESAGGDPIEIAEENMITSAEITFDTINDNTQKKSNAILAKMTLCGKIAKEINDSLIKISEWARDLKNETTYRKVTLTIYEDEDNTTLRIYELPDMFVCDYKETYKSASENDNYTFELKLTQRENRLKEVKTYK